MFHTIKLKKIDFKSNPSDVEPIPVIEKEINEYGSPVNRVRYELPSRVPNVAHYDAATMSLRARLNRGILLEHVDYGVVENDPNKLNASARRLASEIEYRAASRAAASMVPTCCSFFLRLPCLPMWC